MYTDAVHGKAFSPKTGPRILFFSGGTALRDTAHALIRHTHNSVHLITPFDSGGSSAALRRAFAMPAVGDLRSRLMALAEDKRQGNPEIYTLFAYRFCRDETQKALLRELTALAEGRHPLLRQIPMPMQGIIRDHLAWFARHSPRDFPLADASVGNLILASGYLQNRRRLRPALALFSRMVAARGLVRPIADVSAHLAVELESGEVIVGQHRFTGKARNGKAGSVSSPIRRIWITKNETSPAPFTVTITRHTARLIAGADALCYPMGSFYSSVAANLLPSGVGRAVAANTGPKIFIPNMGTDPELLGHTVQTQIQRLLDILLADAPHAAPREMLTAILCDTCAATYPGGIPFDWLRERGIDVITAPLAASRGVALHCPHRVSESLLVLTSKIAS